MTRYSRSEAEQLINDAHAVIDDLLGFAHTLKHLRDANDSHGSEAAWVHARVDQSLAWFTDRFVHLDVLEPLALAFPARLIVNDEAFDVWLSWQQGEACIDWFYDASETFLVRRQLPLNAHV